MESAYTATKKDTIYKLMQKADQIFKSERSIPSSTEDTEDQLA